jgi:hypothetical protein
MVIIMAGAIIATTRIPDILSAFKFIGVFFAGIGTVMIGRWFWWRVNAQTELVSLITTVVIGSAVLIFVPDIEVGGDTVDRFGLRILITTFGVAGIWIPVAYMTSSIPNNATIAFHNKMQIGGVGWNKISEVPSELTIGIYEWILVMALLLCILIGTGKLLFHDWLTGGVLIGCAGVLAIPFASILKRAKLH